MVNNHVILNEIQDRYDTLFNQIIEDVHFAEFLHPFISALKRPFADQSFAGTDSDNCILFGTFCLQVPYELIYAVGGQPIRLCSGIAEAAELCGDKLPKLSCPLVRSLRGFMNLKSSLFSKIDNFIIPTTCDYKVKHFEQMDRNANVWIMELPHKRDSEASQMNWFLEVIRLRKWIEKVSGIKITRKNMLKGIKIVREAQNEYEMFLIHRRKGDVSGCVAMLISNAYFYMNATDWTLALREINLTIEKNSSNYDKKQEKPRILLTGSPIIFPNFKIPILLEKAGSVITIDELCSSERIFSDLISVDDKTEKGLLRAISDRYLLPCTCPTFNSNKNRVKRINELIEKYRIDGVVYYVLKGCHPYDIESFSIEKLIKEQKIPFLKIETDYSEEDIGQIRTRVEAFTEILKCRQNIKV